MVIKPIVSLVLLFVTLWLALDLSVAGNVRVRGAATDEQVNALVRAVRLTLLIKFVLALACLAGLVAIQVLP